MGGGNLYDKEFNNYNKTTIYTIISRLTTKINIQGYTS